MEHLNMSSNHMDKTTNNNDVKNIYKIPDNYSTLQSMTEIKKCVEKISNLQKVLKESSCNSRSSFDQVDRSIISTPKIIAPTIATKELKIISPTIKNEQTKDGNYFLGVLKEEQTRLLNKANEIEEYINSLASEEKKHEEIIGVLRSASGKARLLVSQKMKQFEGLCNSNLNQSPGDKFQTTNEDLQGFWDMVKLQVDNVDSLFAEIEEAKANNWIIQETSSEKRESKPVKSKNTPSSLGKKAPANVVNGAQKADARRKELMELKRKAKTAMQNKDSEPEKSQDPNKLQFFF